MQANTKILLVMLFAVIGCSITFYTINTNIIASPQIPKFVQIKDGDSVYNLKVIQLDSLKYRSVNRDKNITPSINKESILFQQTPVFLVWIMLILIMMTATTAGSPFFIWQNCELYDRFGLNRQKQLRSGLCAVSIVILMVTFLKSIHGLYTPDYIMRDFNILLKNGYTIIQIMVLCTFILLLPALSLMFLVGYSTNTLVTRTKSVVSIEKATQKINYLSSMLLSSLQYLAIIVVLAVLTTNALGSSIKSVIRLDGLDIFPPEISYVYGLFYTLFLSIMYVPIYLLLEYKRKNLLHTLDNFVKEDVTVDKVWATKITDSLNEKNTALDNIKMALTVLAPLITSFLPGQLQLLK